MKKIWAVALLDCRRLGTGLFSAALVAGLIPSLASGLGGTMPVSTVLLVAFIVVGSAAGGYFGNDFVDGRASFFFARPLSTWALIAGRLAALVVLASAVFAGVMASFWLSSSARSDWGPSIVGLRHAAALGTSWALSLYGSLAFAAQGGARRREWRMIDFAKVPLGLALTLGSIILVFGLFADLIVRAYSRAAPARVFFASWIIASVVASFVAMANGRTERLRIARFQELVMFGHAALVTIAVLATWTYVLHPGPRAIQGVLDWSGAPDGRSAYLSATVDRGDPKRFQPVFVIDLASGQTRQLNVNPGQGPWLSADGATLAWSEATPVFFRPLSMLLGGGANFRVRTASGDVQSLPMPSGIRPRMTPREGLFSPEVDRILPSSDGDLFAVQLADRLTFVSRSRGELSAPDLGSGRRIAAIAFLASGTLRAALLRDGAPPTVEFVDIDPVSGVTKLLTSRAGDPRVRFDSTAMRALLTSKTRAGWASVSLLDLRVTADPHPTGFTLSESVSPTALFLADGRIAATTGDHKQRSVQLLSAGGQTDLTLSLEPGVTPILGGEMFPGVLAVFLNRRGHVELALFDTTSGALVRRIADVVPNLSILENPPPPGSPPSRLFLSRDGKLYELPSVSAEPRLLLPLAGR